MCVIAAEQQDVSQSYASPPRTTAARRDQSRVRCRRGHGAAAALDRLHECALLEGAADGGVESDRSFRANGKHGAAHFVARTVEHERSAGRQGLAAVRPALDGLLRRKPQHDFEAAEIADRRWTAGARNPFAPRR